MNIYNDLVKTHVSGASAKELNDIDSRMSDALSNILTGMESVGNLMFWACDSENYTENLAAEDMRNIGGMLSSLMPICRALSDSAGNISCQLRHMEGDK